MPRIRVVIVDDSLFFRAFLSKNLVANRSFELVGTFADPIEALEQIPSIKPDVITVDMEMPEMNGSEFIRKISNIYPSAKCVIISSVSNKVFDAMQIGAIDFVDKPGVRNGYDNEQFVAELFTKIKAAASAHNTTSEQIPIKYPSLPLQTAAKMTVNKTTPTSNQAPLMSGATSRSVIAIGASTGGTEAILEVIKHFPANAPGVVIVQHMPPVFTKMYAERADKICEINVSEAQNGSRVNKGVALIAPGGDQQMYLRKDSNGYYVHLANAEKVSGHCPSVDALFDSVAKTASKDAVGVLLTGMGADGAKGLTTMKKAGAYTIGQDEASCVVYGMPMVAYNMGGVTEQLPLLSIGDAVLRRFK